MADPQLSKALRYLALTLLVGVGIYAFMLGTSTDFSEAKQKLHEISVLDVSIPILLSLTSYCLRFVRWRMIIKAFGYRLPIKDDLIWYLSGFALTMTPGKSGETIRSAFLLDADVPISKSFSAFIMERSFDLLVVGVLAILLVTTPLIAFSAFTLTILTIAVSANYLSRREATTQASSFIGRALNFFRESGKVLRLKLLIAYSALGCGAWVAQGVGFFYIVNLMDQNIALPKAISIYCTGLIAGAASLIPGGLGITEGSLSLLLYSHGVDQNSAILSALISRVCTLWLAVALGCTALAVIMRGNTNKLSLNTISTGNKRR